MAQVSVGRSQTAVQGWVEPVARVSVRGVPGVFSPVSQRTVSPDVVEARWIYDGRRPWRMVSLWVEGVVAEGWRATAADRDGVLYTVEGVGADGGLCGAPGWALDAVTGEGPRTVELVSVP